MRQPIIGLLFLIAASTTCSGAVSQRYWVPPAISDESSAIEEGSPLIPELTVGRLKIVLEQTSLSEVQMRLGGKLGRIGDAGGSVRWLCYYSRTSSTPWVLWIEGISDVHQETVSAFQWERIPQDAEFDSRCQPFAGGVALPKDINLGDTASHVRAVLGTPNSSAPTDSLTYGRDRPFKIHGNQCGTVSGVSIATRQNRVEGITVSQATAC